ncbi:XRE family transcriptional regulator [Streptomyces sp. NBC_00582]|uniref:XRE family transcriptional regulator n=1 Tax=Streptomyces sp. NBC_00582 TaxID=2975783 RepID=UPI002E8155A5|nr:XRE family transcriptional regulator [Streptomyces sp. NBC_00582]WUB64480.1 helix-turn-helix domain-containing protein [Streptomyces sp. NBC_00582]
MVEHAARTDLSDLVRTRRAELGLSLRALALRCINPERPEAGPVVDHNWIDRLEKGILKDIPDYARLAGLHNGLQVPLDLVREAAGAQFWGMDTVWSDDGAVRALVHNFRDMSPEDQAWVQAIIQARRTRE